MNRPRCYNRADFAPTAPAQNGWTEDGRRIMVEIPDKMSKHCHQHHPETGEAVLKGWNCDGCRVDPRQEGTRP